MICSALQTKNKLKESNKNKMQFAFAICMVLSILRHNNSIFMIRPSKRGKEKTFLASLKKIKIKREIDKNHLYLLSKKKKNL